MVLLICVNVIPQKQAIFQILIFLLLNCYFSYSSFWIILIFDAQMSHVVFDMMCDANSLQQDCLFVALKPHTFVIFKHHSISSIVQDINFLCKE